MRARPKNYVLILIGIVCALPFFWLSFFAGQDQKYELLLETRFAELRERLQIAELLNRQRENDLQILRSQFSYLLQFMSQPNTTNRSMEYLSSNLNSPLANFSDLYSQQSLHLPSIFTYLPHLTGKPDALRPRYKLSKNRYRASIVIGIPTIKRDQVSYVSQTLSSLIDGLSVDEKDDCLIVVFVAEPWDKTYAEEVGAQVQQQFSEHINNGLLEVISPPSDFYPDLNNLKESFGDNKERVRWRTKQNLDFSFLMLYARSRGIYYVQLEDDVVSKPGYFSVMKTFAEEQNNANWILLEFSTLGFIGKMFKTSHLPIVVEFFLMFHQDKPIDWLLDYLLAVKVCNPEKDAKHCLRMKAEVRRRYKPSLFQHIGVHSSLKGKTQKLKDKDFGKQAIHRAHVNPKASLATSLKIYQKYTLLKAYTGEDIFWAVSPTSKDYVEITLNEPTELEKILFRSGNSEHPLDHFYNTTLEVLPDPKSHFNSNQYPKTESGYLVLTEFGNNGVAEVDLDDSVGAVSRIRLSVHADCETWVILNEIYIKPRKKS